MRIRPYRTLENVIEGAVITFVDITERKRMEAALEEARLREVALREAQAVLSRTSWPRFASRCWCWTKTCVWSSPTAPF